jgi:hypothetical protein
MRGKGKGGGRMGKGERGRGKGKAARWRANAFTDLSHYGREVQVTSYCPQSEITAAMIISANLYNFFTDSLCLPYEA